MSLFVKLCGLQSVAEVEFAASLGVDALGFVMTPSIRQVDFETGRRLVAAVPEGVISVGVFYRPEADLVRHVRDEVGFDWIQAETESLRGIDGIAAFPVVHDGIELEGHVAEALEVSASGWVLVESAGHGGKGHSAEWARVADLDDVSDVVLAGGLNAGNVLEATGLVHPGGVDVSSGIESVPGIKDPSLMREFVETARRIDRKVAR